MGYFKVRRTDTGKFMDKRYESIYGPTGGLFGQLATARRKKEIGESIFNLSAQNNPDMIIPTLEIVKFELVESEVVE